MGSIPHITTEEITAYLAGEADAKLRAAVERWAASDPAHARELGALRTAWDWAGETGAVPGVDVEAAWGKVLARADAASAQGRVVPMRRPWRWVAAAATVAGLAVAVRMLFMAPAPEYLATDQAVHASLADSSAVVLSPHTALVADLGRQRRVRLEGQAYFEVKRDAARPFIVEAGPVQVMVLGTGFEVSAYDTSGVVRVLVRHGHVRVAAGGDSLHLYAGEGAAYRKAEHRLERMELPSCVHWGDRILHFDQASMAEVVRCMENLYAVRITLSGPGIGRCRLTADFEDEPVERILQVVAETFGLRVETAGDGHYTLAGDGC